MPDTDTAAWVSVFIPAYNAARTVESVIERIPADAWPLIERIFIINDGSADDTRAVADALDAAHEKITAFHFDQNRGYGEVVRQGLKLCMETPATHFVCLHSDGQYPPEKITDFVHHMRDNGIDVLQGSRHKDGTALRGGMPFYKYLAGKILTAMENTVFGLKMTDYHSGYMFYSRRAVRSIPIEELSGYFDFDLCFIASARARRLSIAEKGIPTHYGDEVSYLDPIKYGIRTLIVMGNYLMGRYNPRPEDLRLLDQEQ